jgi:ribosomal protein S18 acetylase RimI-like enzyme
MNEFRNLRAVSPADAAGLADFHRVAAAALTVDGYPPFNEQALFDLQSGRRTAYLVTAPASSPVVELAETGEDAGAGGSIAGRSTADGDDDRIVVGAALSGRGEIDLVIAPEFRRRGYGRLAAGELVALHSASLNAGDPTAGDQQSDAPHADRSQSDVPQSDVPQSDVPESGVPQSDVRQSDVPESDVPQSDVSQSGVSQSGSEKSGSLTAWAHGDHPAARALAVELSFVAARTLLELRKPLRTPAPESAPQSAPASTPESAPESAPESTLKSTPQSAPVTTLKSAPESAPESTLKSTPESTPESTLKSTPEGASAAESEAAPTASAALDGGSIGVFRPGGDDAEWVALNALVFATHPEQGAMTESDLAARQAESWFTAEDFLILKDAAGRMIGYNWLKVEGDIGEIYVIGVHPDAAGRGFGRVLMQAGLKRLVDAGCTTAALYVEADSVGAVHLYRSLGFVDHTVDVQYRLLTH